MRTPINKEVNSKMTEVAAKKLQILSRLIKEKAFARNDKKLRDFLEHHAPTIVQNIKEQNIGGTTTIDRHWKTFVDKFNITDDGIYRLEETLTKYRKLMEICRRGVDSLELLKIIESPTAEKITRTMTFLNKCDIHEKIAFVGLAIYDEMMSRKEFTILSYCDNLRELFTKLWPHQSFAIRNQFTGLEFIDENKEISKFYAIVQTNFNYLLMKQELERIRDMPYTTCFNDSFQRTHVDTDSFWIDEDTGRIWYVNEHVVRKGVDIYVMAIFDEYCLKCSEVYEFTFWGATTVAIHRLPQSLLGYYDYSLSDNGRIIEFINDESVNGYKLPRKLTRSGMDNPAVKFLKEGMDEDSINDAAQTYVYDVITDVIISRQHLTVATTIGTFCIERDENRYPDINYLHPDDDAYLMDLRGEKYIIFRGDYALNIPLQDFEPLTNEE